MEKSSLNKKKFVAFFKKIHDIYYICMRQKKPCLSALI